MHTKRRNTCIRKIGFGTTLAIFVAGATSSISAEDPPKEDLVESIPLDAPSQEYFHSSFTTLMSAIPRFDGRKVMFRGFLSSDRGSLLVFPSTELCSLGWAMEGIALITSQDNEEDFYFGLLDLEACAPVIVRGRFHIRDLNDPPPGSVRIRHSNFEVRAIESVNRVGQAPENK